MNEVLSWLAWGVGILVLAAFVVAGWEHLVREAHGRRRMARDEDSDMPRHAMSIDVRLDTQAAALAAETPEPADPPTDRQNRLSALAEALARAADPSRAPLDRGHWMDTTPRVVGLDRPALAERDRPREKGSSSHG